MSPWPLQREVDSFYGNPRGAGGGPSEKWEAGNLVLVPCPWLLRFEGQSVRGIRIHKRCATSLARVLDAIWARCGRSQAEIDRIGMSAYGGSYNFRRGRGLATLSMHAYGCAVDFDPDHNGLGDPTPAMDRRVIEEFERQGWEWGGHWSRPDGMHFQAARTREVPPRLAPAPAVA
ncbi:M15 family metallopeptidase [Aquabacter sp. L1I39]|uniref:M15 family metallopeptidase n=1 Tax=Aquabacter sp. L1I39 TaxID=2820278 RepID=UPI001ADBDFCC|nr:M15 family metallopeptidase [Aquabacter sp. L1I39]QTL01896.1 M15 family metallopeptidase [Aquabacter sp. L1I39]